MNRSLEVQRIRETIYYTETFVNQTINTVISTRCVFIWNCFSLVWQTMWARSNGRAVCFRNVHFVNWMGRFRLERVSAATAHNRFIYVLSEDVDWLHCLSCFEYDGIRIRAGDYLWPKWMTNLIREWPRTRLCEMKRFLWVRTPNQVKKAHKTNA